MELIGFSEEYDLRSGEWTSWMRFLGPSGEVKVPAQRETIEALAASFVAGPEAGNVVPVGGAGPVEPEPARLDEGSAGSEGDDVDGETEGAYDTPPPRRRRQSAAGARDHEEDSGAREL